MYRPESLRFFVSFLRRSEPTHSISDFVSIKLFLFNLQVEAMSSCLCILLCPTGAVRGPLAGRGLCPVQLSPGLYFPGLAAQVRQPYCNSTDGNRQICGVTCQSH